jgi:hypothetical protein
MNVLAKPYFLNLGKQDVCRLFSMADAARSSRSMTSVAVVLSQVVLVVPDEVDILRQVSDTCRALIAALSPGQTSARRRFTPTEYLVKSLPCRDHKEAPLLSWIAIHLYPSHLASNANVPGSAPARGILVTALAGATLTGGASPAGSPAPTLESAKMVTYLRCSSQPEHVRFIPFCIGTVRSTVDSGLAFSSFFLRS